MPYFWNKKTQIVFYQATLDFNIVYSWIMYSLLQIKTWFIPKGWQLLKCFARQFHQA